MTLLTRITGTSRLKYALLAVALLSLNACAVLGKTDVYRDSNMDFGSLHTVAVLPFTNLTKEQQANDRVRDVFTSELMATGGIYVVPAGEVARGIVAAGAGSPSTPTSEEAMKICKNVKADALFTGTLREYGEIRSGTASANAIVLSMQLMEGQTGRVVWSADTTQGGISLKDRLLGGGGQPLNIVTQKAVNDLIKKLFE